MTRLLGFSVLVLGLTCLLTNTALGQKKGAPRKVDASPATPEQYKLLAKYTEMVGVIQSATVNATGSSIVLRVEYDHPNPNPAAANPNNKNATKPNNAAANAANRNAANHAREAQRIQQQLQKLQRDQVALQQAKTPQQAQQKLQQIARDQQTLQRELYQYQLHETQLQQRQMMAGMKGQPTNTNTNLVKDYIDFELSLTDKAQVRRLSTGIEYDDKGNVKEPDPAAKTAGLPGFAAKLEELAAGGKAKVYLAPPKTTTVAKAAPAKKGADEVLGDAAAALPPANRPQVRMVVLLSEPAGLPGADKVKKKAK